MVRDYEGRGANYTEGMMVIICKKKRKRSAGIYLFLLFNLYCILELGLECIILQTYQLEN